jgi:acetamidase/formamidase
MAHHHLAAGPKTVHWGFFDAALPPVLTIRSGDTVTVETLSGEPADLPEASRGFSLPAGHLEVHAANPVPGPGPHFMTGPIFVEGASPGDVLAIKFLDIALHQDWGWNLQQPLLGTLPEDFPELRRLHIPLDAKRMVATLPWGTDLPLRPFFGAVGVAPPPSWGRLTSIVPRAFGGNIDNKELVVGSTLYLPVFNDGALLSIGDGHAAQGDGEVCLTAIETALTGRVQVTVVKDLTLKRPRAETAESWITMAFDEDLDDAVKQALRDMIVLIGEKSGLSAQDAYSLCSIAADLRVTQTVDVAKGIHCILDKRLLPPRRDDARKEARP